MDKHTPSLRGEVLGADTTGSAVARAGTVQLNWVSSAYCLKRDQFAFGGRKTLFCVLVWDTKPQPQAMEDPTAARGTREQGAGGVNSASWCNTKSGGRVDGRLKPKIKVTIEGDSWVVMFLPSKICANLLLRTRSTSSRCITQTKMEETGCSRGGESW